METLRGQVVEENISDEQGGKKTKFRGGGRNGNTIYSSL